MDKKTDDESKKSVDKTKADLLRSAVSKQNGKCEKCAAQTSASPPMSPMMTALMSKLGFMGLPSPNGGGCTHTHVVVVAKKEPEKAPNVDDPDGQKKVLEKEKTEEKHRTTPFVQRCVAAITGGKTGDKEHESRAFALCNATKNKSERDLDKEAVVRPGYKSRKAEFEQSLEAIRKRKKTRQHEF